MKRRLFLLFLLLLCAACAILAGETRQKRQIVNGGNGIEQTRRPLKIRDCTTPDGVKGFCQSLSECPDLVLKMSRLRKFVCLKRLLEPGFCCPDVGQMDELLRDAPASPAAVQHQSIGHIGGSHSTSHTAPNSPVPLQRPGGQPYPYGFPPILQQSNQGFVHPSRFPFHPGTNPQFNAGSVRPSAAAPIKQAEPIPYNSQFANNNVIINEQRSNKGYECGVPQVPSFRVVGGEQSHVGEWPWMAAIYLNDDDEAEFWCGGALVSEDYVVTAAHCTKDANGNTYDSSQFTIHLGDNNIASKHDDQTSPPKEYGVRFIVPHEDFRKSGFFNDIALIKLTRTVDFSQYILPVCLPPQSMERGSLDSLVGQSPTVIGYGSTKYDGPHSNALRDARLLIWKNRDCDKAYFQPITDIFICAGYSKGGKDACQGDSGGPLQLYTDGRWSLVGIVSFGNRCAEPGYPGVYTRITKFIPWIKKNMR